MRIALKETGARGAVHPVRIEKAPEIVATCDAVSARALAELDLLFEYIHPWARNNPNLKAYFNKGRDYDSEVQKAHGRWQFDLVKHQSAIEADSVVLEISNLTLRR